MEGLESNGAKSFPPVPPLIKPEGELLKPVGELMEANVKMMEPVGELIKPRGELMKPVGKLMEPVGEIMKPNLDMITPEAPRQATSEEIDEFITYIKNPQNHKHLKEILTANDHHGRDSFMDILRRLFGSK